MILFVAQYPSNENQHDGMIQRVANIDQIAEDMPRCYLDISFRKFFSKEVIYKKNLTIYRLNFFLHFFKIHSLLNLANLVYIHSAYNAIKVSVFRYRSLVIFDAHGVVPEEMRQEGKSLSALIYSFYERKILLKCDYLVSVTQKLASHLLAKYPQVDPPLVLILPILPRTHPEVAMKEIQKSKRPQNSVIYAGGTQIWQNIDKMIFAARLKSDMKFTFLSADSSRFQKMFSEYEIDNSECKTVLPQDVFRYYLRNRYGFLLREENLINSVACPTKLVEYLQWGVIPILITGNIGDFNDYSLQYVTLDNFLSGELPKEETIVTMRQNNFKVVQDLIDFSYLNKEKLKILFASHAY